MNELDNKDAKSAYVHSLLPKEKCDTSHNAQLTLLTDEEIASSFYFKKQTGIETIYSKICTTKRKR